MVGVVVLLLLLVRFSALTVEWWYSSSCGVVACVDDCWCVMVGGVCIVTCNVVVVHKGWSVGSGSGGGVLDVGIWIGAYWGSGGIVFGGSSVFVVVDEKVYGCGGGMVVFGLRFRLL